MVKARKKLCDKLLVFSILFFIISLFITSIGVSASEAPELHVQEKASPTERSSRNIQTQQRQIHKRLTQIETRLGNSSRAK